MNDWIACFRSNGVTVHETGTCRFGHDHLNCDTNTAVVVFDGLLLNQKELFGQYHTDDFLTLFTTMQEARPADFFNDFRGPFTGLYYDKVTRRAVVFTNQTGDSAVFYYLSETMQAFSSNYTLLLDFIKKQGVTVTFDEQAAHWMLTFGYLIDSHMMVKEVKRLCAGKALYLEAGRWTERRYHRFGSETLPVSEDEAIGHIDTLFRQAVRRCFDKDLEYGYREHLVDMSAGMDSRMVNCVARSMGYGPITNISYSQTGSEEERLSKAASAHFGNTMVFEPLDDHAFLFDLDDLVRGNFATYLYTGITGGARLLSRLDFNRFGAEQTAPLRPQPRGHRQPGLLQPLHPRLHGSHVVVVHPQAIHLCPLAFHRRGLHGVLLCPPRRDATGTPPLLEMGTTPLSRGVGRPVEPQAPPCDGTAKNGQPHPKGLA